MQDWLQVLRLDTSATEKDRGCDVWDNDNCCNYSADGTKLLDAENYPSEVHVKDGTKVICDGVFAFQPYMAEDRKIGEDIPEEERASFLDKIFLPPDGHAHRARGFPRMWLAEKHPFAQGLDIHWRRGFFRMLGTSFCKLSCRIGRHRGRRFRGVLLAEQGEIQQGFEGDRRRCFSGLRVIGGNCSSGRS